MPQKTITLTEARKKLFKIASEVKSPNTSYHLTMSGKDGVVLISKEEFESWQETLEILSEPETIKDLKLAENDFKKGKYTNWEQAKKKLQK